MKIIIGLLSLLILTVLGTETEFGQFESDPNGYNIQESDSNQPLDDDTDLQQEAAPKEEMETQEEQEETDNKFESDSNGYNIQESDSDEQLDDDTELQEAAPKEEMEARAARRSRFYDIRYMNALDAHINKVIQSNFRNQPVIQLLYLWTDGSRVLKIKKVNGGTLRTSGRLLQRMYMGNGRRSKTGRYLAYRPRFRGYHYTRLGAIFVNLNRLFPCARSTRISCRRFTIEEDGFLKGKAIIEAADLGNHFRVFGRHVDTYGLAFQGCCYLNGANGCLPRWFHTTIACLLPRSCFRS
ncbi:PREDICTED: uncharacterized protein LOC109582697 [Amphimedon queenslandica]|uniref:Uncharacterized protein n=1 Tax=Amphimedon queenslandica TaxID=400682 RepID=A0A1X7UNW2_AMPQE|nr:PREDICTED: uncharacterized protein LOC109582697 [Amphimedon queenslandica]|eukprot:XP_019853127.1 PREDICTED: uncharacterized protein LOC109582697 [Amphimedon queenslandica]